MTQNREIAVGTSSPVASIVLSDMDRTREASYGFRSWILQQTNLPYEVILILFNDEESQFRALAADAPPNCHLIIKSFSRPAFFNISAANNLGLHYSTGKHVFFANSDIIYLSDYLRNVCAELESRGFYYAHGSRGNLTERVTRSLKPAATYSPPTTFDWLRHSEGETCSSVSSGGSPWIVLREVAYAVGGFDPGILCHEDSDFRDRVMHYLRRRQLQYFDYAICDGCGYHLRHAPSELYDASLISRRIVEKRRKLMQLDPLADIDVVQDNDLLDFAALRNVACNTRPPPRLARSRLPRYVVEPLRRVRNAAMCLTHPA